MCHVQARCFSCLHALEQQQKPCKGADPEPGRKQMHHIGSKVQKADPAIIGSAVSTPSK